jgi:hypothetical protein
MLLFFNGLGEGKKGGNTVASAIWEVLNIEGLRKRQTAAEINLVFD